MARGARQEGNTRYFNYCLLSRWLFLGVLFGVSIGASGEERPALHLEPVSEEHPSLEPRSITTLVLRLHNRTDRALGLEAQLKLPPGWRSVTPEYPFKLAAGERQIRFVSYQIPEDAPAGEYVLSYHVGSREEPSLEKAHYTQTVVVLPRPRLNLRTLESPEYVIAGEPYQVRFRVGNQGNLPLEATYRLSIPSGTLLSPHTGVLSLDAGEAQTLAVQVQSENVSRASRVPLTLTLSALDDTLVEQITAPVRVLPKTGGYQERFHLIPASLSLRALSGDKVKEDPEGLHWQTELSGSGYLDESLTRKIQFLLRSPDLRQSSTYGTADEYTFSYSGERFSAALGDRSYAFTPLTESGFYGRGWQIGVTEAGWRLKSYQVEDRFSAQPQRQQGLQLGFDLDATSNMAATFLERQDQLDAKISSLQGQQQWAEGLISDWEIAHSRASEESGHALRGTLQHLGAGSRYAFRWLHASPDYRGDQRDHQEGTLSAEWPLWERWRLQGRYRYQRDNLDLDPTRTAPQTQSWFIGIDSASIADTRIGVDYQRLMRVDLSADHEFDGVNDAIGVSVNHRYQDLSWHLRSSYGVTHQAQLPNRFTTTSHLATLNWRASTHQSYSAYLFYNDSAYATTPNNLQKSVGFNANYQFSKSTSLGLNLNGSIQPERIQSSYQVHLQHQLPRGQSLQFLLRGSNDVATPNAFMATYRIPFGIPVARKENMAGIQGRLYDVESNKGLAHVPINLGGHVTVSDGAGYFTYPALPLGEYYLMVERQGEVRDRIPANQQLTRIILDESREYTIDIPMVRAASLHGQVLRYGHDAIIAVKKDSRKVSDSTGSGLNLVSDSSAPVSEQGVANALISLSNGKVWYKRTTDNEGNFQLNGIPPGTWNVRIDPQAIPNTHQAKQSELSVTVKAGEQGLVEFILRPKIRKIRMMNDILLVTTAPH